MDALEQTLEQAETKRSEAYVRCLVLEGRLNRLESSFSWRVTSPLRALFIWFYECVRSMKNKLKTILFSFCSPWYATTEAHIAVQQRVATLLKYCGLYPRIHRIYRYLKPKVCAYQTTPRAHSTSYEQASLSAKALKRYNALNQALD